MCVDWPSSAQIRAESNDYYDILEQTQKGGLDVTLWMELESWRARQDSNLWPSAPEADALSS